MSNTGENTHKQLQYRKFIIFTFYIQNDEYDKNG
jgi:hypothetical protein